MSGVPPLISGGRAVPRKTLSAGAVASSDARTSLNVARTAHGKIGEFWHALSAANTWIIGGRAHFVGSTMSHGRNGSHFSAARALDCLRSQSSGKLGTP